MKHTYEQLLEIYDTKVKESCVKQQQVFSLAKSLKIKGFYSIKVKMPDMQNKVFWHQNKFVVIQTTIEKKPCIHCLVLILGRHFFRRERWIIDSPQHFLFSLSRVTADVESGVLNQYQTP